MPTVSGRRCSTTREQARMSKRGKGGVPDDENLRVARRGSTNLLRLHEREVQVLEWVFADLERLLGEEPGTDPVKQRLFPRASLEPTEEAAEAQRQSSAPGALGHAR